MERKDPVPQGKYVPAVRYGNFIFTAGMTPRQNGIATAVGRVKADEPLELYRAPARRAALNALNAALNKLREGEKIVQVLDLKVYINAEEDFTAHAKLADFVSEYLTEELGEAGIAPRAAIGMGTLPAVAPIEVQLICAAE